MSKIAGAVLLLLAAALAFSAGGGGASPTFAEDRAFWAMVAGLLGVALLLPNRKEGRPEERNLLDRDMLEKNERRG